MSVILILVLRMLHVRIMMAPSAVLVMKDTMEMELILVKVSKHYNYYTTWLMLGAMF